MLSPEFLKVFLVKFETFPAIIKQARKLQDAQAEKLKSSHAIKLTS